MTVTNVAASYDYFNPFLSAQIVTGNGKGDRYPLWTSKASGQSISVPASPGQTLRALAFLTELQVEMQLAGIPRITAKLEPPYADAVKFLDSELVEFGMNRLQVQYGYARGVLVGGKVGALVSDPMEGMLLRPEVTLGIETSIVLTAQGTNGNVTGDQPGSGETLKGTRRKIIETLCGRMSMEANFDACKDDASATKALAKEETIAQGWRSDIYLLHYISNLCGCSTRTISNNDATRKAIYEVIPRSSLAKLEPDHTLAMFHLPKGKIGGSVYPMLSAQTPTGAIYLPGVRKVIMREIDSKTRLTKENRLSDKQVAAPQTGPGAGDVKGDVSQIQQADPNKPVGYQPHPGDPGAETYVEQAKGMFEAQKLAMGFPLDVETVGIPTISPGDIVRVAGLGMRLDTNYAVIKVVHTLNSSGYVTSLHLISNAGNLVAAQLAVQANGAINTNEPSENGGDNVKAQPK